MQAVLLTAYGGVDKLELSSVREPSPGPNELKVRVVSASVNPVDYKLRSGALKAWMPLELPAILGRDVAGEVIEVGEAVRDIQVGDHVLGLVDHGYAEYVVSARDSFAKLPSNLNPRDAAALPLVSLTGAQLIEEAVRAKAGERVLVTGALGSVGRVAVHVAKQRGCKVIAGVRFAQKIEAESLGADLIVALDRATELDSLPELDALADTVGGETTQKLLEKIRPGGVVGSVVGEPEGAAARGLTVRAFLVHPDSKRLAELAEAFVRLEFELPIGRRFPLSDIQSAHRVAEAHGTGKILLDVS